MHPELSELENFYKKLSNHNNDRYRSFEHCYLYFSKLKENLINENIKYIDLNYEQKEKAMLHLGFYLASWGMYRGSSFLLQKDYNVYRKIIEIIFDDKYNDLWNIDENLMIENISNFCELSFSLHQELQNAFEKERREYFDYVGKPLPRGRVSSILTTKIIMGTIGCLPAYDRFFKSGIKHYNDSNNVKLIQLFSQNSIKKIYEFCVDNKKELIKIQKDISKYSKVRYPLFKLIDSYFWQIGYRQDSKVD